MFIFIMPLYFEKQEVMIDKNQLPILLNLIDDDTDIVNMKTSTASIINRVINNLINAYENQNDKVNAEFFRSNPGSNLLEE